MELGCLIYDIPATNTKVYSKVKSIMGGFGLPLNLSVYLIPWGVKEKINELLKNHITSDCSIHFIKFDSSSFPELRKRAVDSANKLISYLYKRITDKIQEIRSQSESKQYNFKYEINKKLQKSRSSIYYVWDRSRYQRRFRSVSYTHLTLPTN